MLKVYLLKYQSPHDDDLRWNVAVYPTRDAAEAAIEGEARRILSMSWESIAAQFEVEELPFLAVDGA